MGDKLANEKLDMLFFFGHEYIRVACKGFSGNQSSLHVPINTTQYVFKFYFLKKNNKNLKSNIYKGLHLNS